MKYYTIILTSKIWSKPRNTRISWGSVYATSQIPKAWEQKHNKINEEFDMWKKFSRPYSTYLTLDSDTCSVERPKIKVFRLKI